jgi:hypothetical protein
MIGGLQGAQITDQLRLSEHLVGPVGIEHVEQNDRDAGLWPGFCSIRLVNKLGGSWLSL